MEYSIRIRPRAACEIDRAASWWSKNRPAAPGAIETELAAAFELLVNYPESGILVEGARDPRTRKLYLDRIHYLVFYRPRGPHLQILAFWHSACGRTPKV